MVDVDNDGGCDEDVGGGKWWIMVIVRRMVE